MSRSKIFGKWKTGDFEYVVQSSDVAPSGVEVVENFLGESTVLRFNRKEARRLAAALLKFADEREGA